MPSFFRLRPLTGAITSPTVDSDATKALAARTLHSLLIGVLLWLGLFSAVILPCYALRKGAGSVLLVVFTLLVLTSLFYLSRGYVKLASWIFLTCMWFMVTIILLFSGGITNRGTMFYVAISVTAAWLVGQRIALISSGLFVGAALIMALLELAGVGFPRYFPDSPIVAWMLVLLFTAVAILPVNQVLLSLNEALKQARERLEDLKHREMTLQESQQQLVSIYNTVEDLIFHLAIEPEGQFRIVSVNAAFLRVTGLSQEEVCGKTVNELVPEPSLTTVCEKYRQAIEEKTAVHWEETSDNPTGRLTGKVSVAPIFDKTGTCTHLVGSVHDITEIRRAHEIQNRLASNLESSRNEIRALAASLMKAQEDERRRVSRELHDQICQQLAALSIEIGGLAAKPPSREDAPRLLKVLQRRIVKASEEARHIAYELHPSMLDDLGLAASLRALCQEFSAQHLNMELRFSGEAEPVSVPREVASCVFRVALESLQNIAKHSKAKHVSVALAAEKRSVALTIADDGAGFDLKAVQGRGGLGLIGMEERVRVLNGTFTITAQPGHGAQISLAIPVPESTA